MSDESSPMARRRYQPKRATKHRGKFMYRRDLLRAGILSGLALVTERAFAQSAAGKTIPWADQPPPIPPPAQNAIHNLTPWESLDSWITPNVTPCQRDRQRGQLAPAPFGRRAAASSHRAGSARETGLA